VTGVRRCAFHLGTLVTCLFLTAGCSASFPDLHGREFAEYYKTSGTIDVHVIDDRWKQSFGRPIEIGEDQFGDMVLRSSLPVVVQFYATWCEYCREFEPVFEQVSKEFEGKVRFAKIDAEANRKLSNRMHVAVYPLFFLIRNGEVQDRWGGIRGGKQAIEERLKK
jgi:thiol-disulfide isomerase/thioredoxin